MIREVARQGLLPYGSFFSSTAPFGTPLAPAGFKLALTYIVIAAIPAKDAFNFLLDLASYPHLVKKFISMYLRDSHLYADIPICFVCWNMAATETAVYRRSLAIRVAGEEPQCAFVSVCQSLLDCHAMVRINVHIIISSWKKAEISQGASRVWPGRRVVLVRDVSTLFAQQLNIV